MKSVTALLPKNLVAWMSPGLVAVVVLLGFALPAPARDRKVSQIDPEGWEVLYSGRVHQFRGYKLFDFPRKSWRIDRGELKSIAGAPQVDLVSLALYQDFELQVEWRVASGADGGILYRVMEDEGPTWHSGLEYQLVDDSQLQAGGDGRHATGSLFDVVASRVAPLLKPPGQYNQTIIRVVGGVVEHWLNGEKVMSADLESAAFRASVGLSRFKNLPRFGREREGHVSLQHKGDEVAFRSIRVRRIGVGSGPEEAALRPAASR